MSSEPMPTLKTHLSERSTWLRGLFMLLYAIIFWITEIILSAVAVFQFLSALFTGRPNARLVTFGAELGRYFQQLVGFLTYEQDERPFPFADWPRAAKPSREPDEAADD